MLEHINPSGNTLAEIFLNTENSAKDLQTYVEQVTVPQEIPLKDFLQAQNLIQILHEIKTEKELDTVVAKAMCPEVVIAIKDSVKSLPLSDVQKIFVLVEALNHMYSGSAEYINQLFQQRVKRFRTEKPHHVPPKTIIQSPY
jgi:hypothetical protein